MSEQQSITDVATVEQQIEAHPPAEVGNIYLNPAAFEHAQRVAKVFATSKLVPDHYKGNLGDCIIAMEMASRLGVHPMMVMQNTHVVHGKPGFDGKFVIALVNTRGPFDGPLEFEKVGKEGQDSFGVKCIARLRGKELSHTITIGDAKRWGWYQKNGSPWQKDAELMCTYRSASFLAKKYCPEVTMGLQTTEEIIDITNGESEDINEKLKGKK